MVTDVKCKACGKTAIDHDVSYCKSAQIESLCKENTKLRYEINSQQMTIERYKKQYTKKFCGFCGHLNDGMMPCWGCASDERDKKYKSEIKRLKSKITILQNLLTKYVPAFKTIKEALSDL